MYQAVAWARETAWDLWTLAHSMSRRENDKEPQRWKPPNHGWIKINVDVAFYAETGSGAVAGVCRDDQGCFLMAQGSWYDRILDAGMMEAIACRDALKEAQLWDKLEFERSPVGSVLSEMKELSSAFSRFVFKFVSRSCNRIVHLLAKQFEYTQVGRCGMKHRPVSVNQFCMRLRPFRYE